ncbi:MAG: hypothetical protein JWM68_3604 [Verrucomicrobiales bacterium]|nr:hypothetical protein [Verrucomicrobiales bacterium]
MLDSLDTLIGFALIFTVISLLLTIAVQLVTSLSNLRGKNLSWGVAEAFEAIAPDLKAKAGGQGKRLADQLLKDPLISDSQFGRWVGKTNAVRAEELFDLLHRIAIGKKTFTPDQLDKNTTPAQIRDDVIALFKNLGVPAHVFEMAAEEKAKLEKLKTDITAQLTVLPEGPTKQLLLAEAKKAEDSLTLAATSAEEAAIRWAAQGEAAIQRIYQKFEHWFDTGEERAQEWFTTHARIITSILGLAAAFVLQLDTIEIYKLVSSNRAVRESLVAQTQAVLDQGEKVLKEKRRVMATALNTIRANGTNNAFLTNVVVAATDTVGTVKAEIWKAARASHQSDEKTQDLIASFDQQTLEIVKTDLTKYSGEYNAMAKSLDKTGFELFPKGSWRWVKQPASGFWGTIWDTLSDYEYWGPHLLGIIFSAFLLSLGAPFWFNILKSLSSLRSSVAKKICEEDTADQKSGKTDQPSKAPVTVK